MHLCDTPACGNLDHIRIGTQGDNMHDAALKGRLAGSIHGSGEAHRFSLFTEDQIGEVRRRYAKGETQSSIAASFGIGQPAISRIVNRKRWR